MITSIHRFHKTLSYRVFSTVIAITFILGIILPPNVCAQAILNLPAPGTMISTSAGFMPAMMTGVTVNPDNPLRFDFIMDRGQSGLEGEALKSEYAKMIKYFMASLTVPEDELWVNLSPYEKDRMIAQGLGQTEMGRDMLAQDYLLKQLTASLMYPEEELGKKFWDKIYKIAQERFGTTEIPVNTFNKVWIVPDEALVYEQGTSAFVIKSRLAVMLEQDYLAANQGTGDRGQGTEKHLNPQPRTLSPETEIIREVIIPEIEKEINEGENFANLRQIYNALILAVWYKQRLKDSLLGKVYVNQNKTKGIDTEDKEINQKIYNQYIESFKKGVYNFIKEDVDPVTQQIIPRKYLSGGLSWKLGTKMIGPVLLGTALLLGRPDGSLARDQSPQNVRPIIIDSMQDLQERTLDGVVAEFVDLGLKAKADAAAGVKVTFKDGQAPNPLLAQAKKPESARSSSPVTIEGLFNQLITQLSRGAQLSAEQTLNAMIKWQHENGNESTQIIVEEGRKGVAELFLKRMEEKRRKGYVSEAEQIFNDMVDWQRNNKNPFTQNMIEQSRKVVAELFLKQIEEKIRKGYRHYAQETFDYMVDWQRGNGNKSTQATVSWAKALLEGNQQLRTPDHEILGILPFAIQEDIETAFKERGKEIKVRKENGEITENEAEILGRNLVEAYFRLKKGQGSTSSSPVVQKVDPSTRQTYEAISGMKEMIKMIKEISETPLRLRSDDTEALKLAENLKVEFKDNLIGEANQAVVSLEGRERFKSTIEAMGEDSDGDYYRSLWTEVVVVSAIGAEGQLWAYNLSVKTEFSSETADYPVYFADGTLYFTLYYNKKGSVLKLKRNGEAFDVNLLSNEEFEKERTEMEFPLWSVVSYLDKTYEVIGVKLINVAGEKYPAIGLQGGASNASIKPSELWVTDLRKIKIVNRAPASSQASEDKTSSSPVEDENSLDILGDLKNSPRDSKNRALVPSSVAARELYQKTMDAMLRNTVGRHGKDKSSDVYSLSHQIEFAKHLLAHPSTFESGRILLEEAYHKILQWFSGDWEKRHVIVAVVKEMGMHPELRERAIEIVFDPRTYGYRKDDPGFQGF